MEELWGVLLGLEKAIGGVVVDAYKSRRRNREHAEHFEKHVGQVQSALQEAIQKSCACAKGACFNSACVSGTDTLIERWAVYQERTPALWWYDQAMALGRRARVELNLTLVQQQLFKSKVPSAESIARELAEYTHELLEQHGGALTPDAVDTVLQQMVACTRERVWKTLCDRMSSTLQRILGQDAFFLTQQQWSEAWCAPREAMDQGNSMLQLSREQWTATQRWALDALLVPFKRAIEGLCADCISAEKGQELKRQIASISHCLTTQLWIRDQLPVKAMHKLKIAIFRLLTVHRSYEEAAAFSDAIEPVWQLFAQGVLGDLEHTTRLMEALVDWEPEHLELDSVEQRIHHALQPLLCLERKQCTMLFPPKWVWQQVDHRDWRHVAIGLRAVLAVVASAASTLLTGFGLSGFSLACQGIAIVCDTLTVYHRVANDWSDYQANQAARRHVQALEDDDGELKVPEHPPFGTWEPAQQPALKLLARQPRVAPAKSPNTLIGIRSASTMLRTVDCLLQWTHKTLFDALMACHVPGLRLVLNTAHQVIGFTVAASDWINACHRLYRAVGRYRADSREARSPDAVRLYRRILAARAVIWLMDTLACASVAALLCHIAWLSGPVLLGLVAFRTVCKLIRERAKAAITAWYEGQSPSQPRAQSPRVPPDSLGCLRDAYRTHTSSATAGAAQASLRVG